MLGNWPWTLLVILPINRTLMATDPAAADAASRTLLVKWNRLHAVRSVFGAASIVSFLWALA